MSKATIAKSAGLISLAILAGVAQGLEARETAARRIRPFSPRLSDEYDEWTLILTSGEDELMLTHVEDEMFIVFDSTIKGCKPGRIVRFENDDLARTFERYEGSRQYLREEVQDFDLYVFGSYAPLLFSRENKSGEMVNCYLPARWSAKARCVAGG